MNQEVEPIIEETSTETSTDHNHTCGSLASAYENLMYSYSVILSERDYLRAEIERCRRTERFTFFSNFINLFSTLLSLDPQEIDHQEVVRTIQSQINQTLQRVQITPFSPEIGSLYNPNEHQVISQIPAQENQTVNSISRTFGVGFRHGETIISRANVVIYSQNNTTQQTSEETVEEDVENTTEDINNNSK